MREVLIVSGSRTPTTKYGGELKFVEPGILGGIVYKDVLERANLASEDADGVIMGCVLQTSESPNVARLALIHGNGNLEKFAITINVQCGSGLKAINQCARYIERGDAEVMIGGGVEVMSRSPYLSYTHRWGHKMGEDKFIDYFDHLQRTVSTDLHGVFTMPDTAQWLADEFEISREDQDKYAAWSHEKAIKAIGEGIFKKEIVPVTVSDGRKELIVETDTHPRRDSDFETLQKMRPAFCKDGTITVGNSCGINDGAAAVCLMSREKAEKSGVRVFARIKSTSIVGIHPKRVLFASYPAAIQALEKAGLDLNDLDLLEIHEPFAASVLSVIKALGLPFNDDRINVNGAAISLGHPVGCTGARSVVTLIHEMERRDSKYGLVSFCAGGGIGVATVFERVG